MDKPREKPSMNEAIIESLMLKGITDHTSIMKHLSCHPDTVTRIIAKLRDKLTVNNAKSTLLSPFDATMVSPIVLRDKRLAQLAMDVAEIDLRLCDTEIRHGEFSTLTALKNKLLDKADQLNGLDISYKVAEHTAIRQASSQLEAKPEKVKVVSYTPAKKNARKSAVVDAVTIENSTQAPPSTT